MTRPKVAPSILSADFARLGDEIRRIERAGADWVHVDVMDGRFVPNLSFGAPVIEKVRSVTALPFDTHLMILEPERTVRDYVRAGSDHVTVHVEATTHLHRTLQEIRTAGAKPGVAVNPATPLSAIENVLPDIEVLILMTVNPGFSGQRFIASLLPKIERAREMLDRAGSHAELVIDGGVTPEIARLTAKAGASVHVAGSAFFASGAPDAETIEKLRG